MRVSHAVERIKAKGQCAVFVRTDKTMAVVPVNTERFYEMWGQLQHLCAGVYDKRATVAMITEDIEATLEPD